MLKTKLGILQYLFWRGDKVWRNLSEEDKQIVKKANLWHNVERDDYKNPEKYGAGRIKGGETWDSKEDRLALLRGKILNDVLEKEKPETVLEIGPGPGFFTKLVCQKKIIKRYVGLDIARSFLDYLSVRLSHLKSEKTGFSFEFLIGDFCQMDFKEKPDFILLISTAHHIPNRVELFRKLSSILKPGGAILSIDPSHYLPRKIHLLKRIPVYLRKSYYSNIENLSTHSMLTLKEYKKIAESSGLSVSKEWYILPNRILNKRLAPKFLRSFSAEIAVLLKKI